jgi:O-antigen/teichoic acid export membrane protein
MINRILFAYLGALAGIGVLFVLGALAAVFSYFLPLPIRDSAHWPILIIPLAMALIGLLAGVSYTDIKQRYSRSAVFGRSACSLITSVLLLGGLYEMIEWDGLVSLLMAVFGPLLVAVLSGLILTKRKQLPEN